MTEEKNLHTEKDYLDLLLEEKIFEEFNQIRDVWKD